MRVGYIAAEFSRPVGHGGDPGRGARFGCGRLIPLDVAGSALRRSAPACCSPKPRPRSRTLTLDNTDDTLARQDPGAWPNSFRKARFLSAVDHIQLDRLRRRVMRDMDTLFRRDRCSARTGDGTGRMTVIGNMTGHPCLTIRAGFTASAHAPDARLPARRDQAMRMARAHAVPYAITVMAPLFDEAAALTLGRALETALDVADRRPGLV